MVDSSNTHFARPYKFKFGGESRTRNSCFTRDEECNISKSVLYVQQQMLFDKITIGLVLFVCYTESLDYTHVNYAMK